MTTPTLWTGMQSHDSSTNKGAVTHSTSSNFLVDLFFALGAMRSATKEHIIDVFSKAYYTNPNMTMKCLFYARDIRGGQGERQFFRICLEWLAANAPAHLTLNCSFIPFYGRYDDYEALIGTNLHAAALHHWGTAILNGEPLACKWAPREKSSKRHIATLLRKRIGMSPKQYRKHLAAHSKVVETQMCAKNWEEINFSHVPSRAMSIYRKAFERNSDNFKSWLESLAKGEVKVNSSTLYPYELVKAAMSYDTVPEDNTLLESMWDALPDYFDGSARNVLPVIDVSGSMSEPVGGFSSGSTTSCMHVAIGLGMYCAERTQGAFKNKFVTFHDVPSLIDIPAHRSFTDRCRFIERSDWGGTTNFQATFNLILDTAIRNKLSQSDLPEVVLCVSDMEFDQAHSSYGFGGYRVTNFESIKEKFERAGYKLPQLVFWRVNQGGNKNVPVKFNEHGVALVSGFSPSIMKTILTSEELSPLKIVEDALNASRYSCIRDEEVLF